MRDPFEKSSDKNIVDHMRRESAEQDLRGAVERMIDEAQRKGVFDNLPGKGKPLRLGKNWQAGESALAFDLLQNNNYTLPWIAARQETLAAVADFRASLMASWLDYLRRMQEAAREGEREKAIDDWQAEKDRLSSELRELNKDIAALNLTIPVERLEVIKLSWQHELARAGAGE